MSRVDGAPPTRCSIRAGPAAETPPRDEPAQSPEKHDVRRTPMIPFFAGYAVAVWLLVFRARRSLPGLGVLAMGIGGLVGLAYLHVCLNRWTDGRIYLPVLQAILYPYIALVAVIGSYLWCFPPRIRGVVGRRCLRCGYDMAGLSFQAACPECGAAREAPAQTTAR